MRLLPLITLLILAACTLAVPGIAAKPNVRADNPITAGAITVTTLDTASPAQNGVPRPKPKPTKPGQKPDAAVSPPGPPPAKPGLTPDEVPPIATAPAAPPRVISEAERVCVKQGGQWSKVGKSNGETCVKLTKDSGKQCDAESDCEGYCLARSGTCAPFTPMFGCNDILQDNGVRVTLCID